MTDTWQETGGTGTWDFQSQIDEVCDLFESALKGGGRPRIEDYLNESPVPARAALLRELIPLDMEYRKRNGETVSEDDYRERFPSWSRDESALGPGSTIPLQAGLYCVESEIGTGGMGEVYRVQDSDLNRSLAVKVLRREHRGRPDLEARFLEEAQILGQLQHPGIVPVHDVGRLDDGRPFFVMKLVKGQTLAELLQERPRPDHDLPRFLAIFEQICQTMANAHAHGVIHRDLKPSNVMVGAFGEVQVMDWGLAKVLSADRTQAVAPAKGQGEVSIIATSRRTRGDHETDADTPLGTAPFMPPEQASGQVDKHDERSDVFLLGGVLSVILTGHAPYEVTSGLGDQRRGEVQPAYDRLEASGADNELIELAKACLTPDRGARPRNAGAVAKQVAGYQAAVRERLRQAELAQAAATAREEEARATAAQERRSAKAERRARRLTAGLAVALLVVIVVIASGAWWYQQRRITANADTLSALAEAGVLLDQARSEPLADARKYREALIAARKAEQLAQTGGASADIQKQAGTLVAEVEREVEAASRDRQLLAGLLDARGPREVPRYFRDDKGLMTQLAEPSADEQFAAAFREWGLDVDATPTAEAADCLKGRPAPVVTEVVAALDEWASERQREQKPRNEWQRIADLAATLDDDPGAERGELRAIMARGNLPVERAVGELSHLLLPLSVLADQAPGEDRNRLRRLAERTDAATAPVLSLLTLARALQVAGDDTRAERLLQTAVHARPQEVVLRFTLARLLEGQRPPKWQEAAACYEAARALRPELGVALVRALVKSGRAERGLELAERLVAERPDNPVLHFELGCVLQDKKDLKGAIRCYRSALELDPRIALAHNNLGNALKANGELEKAIQCFRTAIELDPKSPLAHYNLGNALSVKGNPEEAIDCYHNAIAIDREYKPAHYNLGVTLYDLGRYKEAEMAFREAMRLKPDFPGSHSSLGSALASQERLKEAEAEFREAIRLEPGDLKGHYNLGTVLVHQGRFKEAETSLREAIRLKPDAADSHVNLGYALKGQSRFNEAEEEYREAIRLKSDSAEAHNGLGIILFRQGHYKEAEAEDREALRLKPDYPQAHHNLGNTLDIQGRLEEGEAEYRQAIHLKPDYAATHNALGQTLLRQSRVREAEGSFREALRLRPDAEGYNKLGIFLSQQGRFKEAETEYREAIRLKVEYPEAEYNLGNALTSQGRFEEALESFRRSYTLGKGVPGLRDAAAAEVRRCEHLIELDRKLLAVLEGGAKPADVNEEIALAQVCHQYKKLYAAAAHLYGEALAAQPKLASDVRNPICYNGACAAAMAGSGLGKDADTLDDKDRPRLRKQALDWLRADLVLWTKQGDSPKVEDRAMVVQVLKHWQEDPDLAGVRDKSALEMLPEAERQQWQKLWADVEALRQQASDPK
jgi:Flp pilus assembly protein TadD